MNFDPPNKVLSLLSLLVSHASPSHICHTVERLYMPASYINSDELNCIPFG